MSRTLAIPAARSGRPLTSSFLLLGLLVLPGCGKGDGTYEITDVREMKNPSPAAPEHTLAERLGADRIKAAPDPAGGSMWDFTTPAGWTELPAAPMRDLGWRVAGNPDAECTFSTLPKGGGGLAANVNRWRKQMSLEPLDDAAVEALPQKTLLGRPATLVELSGAYVGMGGSKTLEGAKMLGLIADLPMATAFLKMKGPAAVVDAESAHFHELAASLAMRKGGAPHGAPSPAPKSPEPKAPESGAEGKAPFQWTAPEGWTKGPEMSMRLVTYVPQKAPSTSCSVVVLGGAAGGAKANVDRWAGQMGLPALTDEAFQKLDRKTILGKSAVFCELAGTYSGMGGENHEGWVMLGMVLERQDDVIFVKMTGPAEEVRGEKDRFRAFCESFRE